jgi:MFS family permease
MQSPYRWVIVAAGAFLGCVSIGSIFSLPVFLQPMAADTGWSRTGISAAMTLDFIAMGIAAFGWGMVMDRYGPRIVVLCGAGLLGLGLVLASRASSVLEFQLLYGCLVGVAGGAIFAPMMATVTGWFDRQRSLAVSLVSAGMGVAPMTVAPFAAKLVSIYDWRTSQLVIGVIVWALLLPVALLVRRAPALARTGSHAAATSPISARVSLRSPQFAVLAGTYFFCCATHSGPLFHTVSYAVTCGLPLIVAVSIYSVEGLAGLFGRVVFGLLGDRLGAKRVLVSGLLVQAFGAGAYFFARQATDFYTVAAVFGFAYAGVMPLYAVLARENFPLPIMGTIVGAATLASCFGMALGPLAGGLIFDATTSYGWLYIGSFGIGLGAAAIMLLFRPAPRFAEGLVVPAE